MLKNSAEKIKPVYESPFVLTLGHIRRGTGQGPGEPEAACFPGTNPQGAANACVEGTIAGSGCYIGNGAPGPGCSPGNSATTACDNGSGIGQEPAGQGQGMQEPSSGGGSGSTGEGSGFTVP